MEWTVSIEAASCGGDNVDLRSKFRLFLKCLSEFHATGYIDGEGWSLVLRVKATDAREAGEFAQVLLSSTLGSLNMPVFPLIALTIVLDEYVAGGYTGLSRGAKILIDLESQSNRSPTSTIQAS
jgi:hypothetical protein